ncbi:DUF3298 and DUF4163 domain-containing protein [Sphingomonas sanguinis]|uniref:DUF3298 and DUF4163 domain-containing protein n=1 Tax=Sphingomonas sanguinis TaxID=33051 RepID=A0ABU5LLX8_9SPHN|nr:DUF4163 domain-containing protein [Sphingomonas sanguinis]MDZ7280929.1 DUF3298 and DUF4163 domain-containing protein [Sphingomonas sanguinis]
MMRKVMIALALIGAAGPAMAQVVTREAKTADYEFSYAYPAAVARIAGLKSWLDAERARIQAKTARDGASARRDARQSGFPYNRYSFDKTWKVVTDTPRFLSLSGNSYNFTGGAHGTPASYGLVWDKAAGRRLDPKAVFTSLPALQTAIRTDYCARLKAEQLKRNQGEVSSMNACPPVKDLTLLLGSTNGRAIDRIGLIADPYVAGSYAEGAYEVTLPVTRAVIGAVKPEYRGAFAVRG